LSQRENGVIVVDENKCNGCGWCIQACPFGAITFNPDNRKAMICDLCDGDPECVKYCPFDALTFSPIDDITYNLRKNVLTVLLKGLADKEI